MGSRGKKVRLFVAAEIPEDVREGIADAIEPLRNEFPGTRWVPPENWHVTVSFLGATEASRVPWIESQLDEGSLRSSAADLEIEGLVFWAPSRRKPMLWVQLADPDRDLARIAYDVAESLEPEFSRERRKLRPHVTLARAWNGPPRVGVLLERSAFRVDRLTLFRSDLGGSSPIYTALRKFPLGP
jgi:2'-5' RNA ligase